VSEGKGSKETLLSEDRLSVLTYADTNHNVTRYYAEVEVNGRKTTSEKHASTDLFKDFERTVERASIERPRSFRPLVALGLPMPWPRTCLTT